MTSLDPITRRNTLLGASGLAAVSALGSSIGSALSPANAQTAPAGGSPYSFERGFPTADTARRIQDEQDEQRALQAYRFFYPTVSMEATFQGSRDAGAEDNKAAMIMAAGPRHVIFTANSDTPYMGAALNLQQAGPMVVELPAGPYLGVINDHHYRYVADLGIPGEDAGRGGKHLVLPPNFMGDVPAGYYTVRSSSNLVLLAARALPTGGDMQGALEAQRRIKIYPLSQASNPPALAFVDKTDQMINMTPLRWEDNLQYWEKLHKVLQEEPALNEFRPMYGVLSALGIEQGKPFAPDARMRAILERAAKAGRDQMLVAGFASSRPDRMVWRDRKWEWAALRYENGDFETPTGRCRGARPLVLAGDCRFAQNVPAHGGGGLALLAWIARQGRRLSRRQQDLHALGAAAGAAEAVLVGHGV
jgi:hypothetical protein